MRHFLRSGTLADMRSDPLPAHLSTRAFSVGEAKQAGTTPSRLRAADLNRTVWGIRRADRDEDLRARCEMYARRLPSEMFFSHSTAALLLGAPLPLRVERQLELHVTAPAPHRAPHARGIRGHSLAPGHNAVVETQGIRHSSPARTWRDLGRVLSVPDLVAVGDHFIHWRLPLTTIEALEQEVHQQRSQPGARRLRAALDLLNDRAESRQESILRVELELRGLPRPRINRTVATGEHGPTFRTDFTFYDELVVLEYQGDYHRAKDQWRRDMTRRSRLEAAGWYVLEINADDLHDPDELATRIRTVLSRRRSGR